MIWTLREKKVITIFFIGLVGSVRQLSGRLGFTHSKEFKNGS